LGAACAAASGSANCPSATQGAPIAPASSAQYNLVFQLPVTFLILLRQIDQIDPPAHPTTIAEADSP
jgi:hypothetical protein